jgi:RimJ/RimL family protein N-acetyltransferase
VITALTPVREAPRRTAEVHELPRAAARQPSTRLGLKVERTTDAEAIRAVITHPEVQPDIWDPEGEPPVPLHDTIYHFLVKEEQYADGAVHDELVGWVAMMPVNGLAWNPHIAILPRHRGKGTAAMQLAIEWMFANTLCEKLVAYPPVFNTKMIRVFTKCGLKREGMSPRSFRWRDEIHDRLLMGIEKPGVA